MVAPVEVHLTNPEDRQKLKELRKRRPAHHRRTHENAHGARIADAFAAIIGSWKFIIIQTVILAIWVILNILAFIQHWDPYPFILLNLALSFQAAYAGPIIMMSQNRQAEIDRRNAEHDYEVNVKAELEIELLHNKVDALREQEIVRLTRIIEDLATQLRAREKDQPA